MGGRLCGVDSKDFDAKDANGVPMHYNRHLWLMHIASKVRLVFPIVVGIAAIFVTVLLHASVTVLVVSRFMARITCGMASNSFRRGAFLAAAATVLALKHYADIVLWAIAYLYFAHANELTDLGTAIYFSSVTYTTLGYGDIVLNDNWRLICGVEAMNGTLLFGWSTALLFLLVRELYFPAETTVTRKP